MIVVAVDGGDSAQFGPAKPLVLLHLPSPSSPGVLV